MDYSVTVEEFAAEFKLTTLTKKPKLSEKHIYHADINRLALQLTGFFEHFDCDRIQIIGLVEYAYLKNIDADTRSAMLEELFKCGFPCLVLTRELPNDPELIYFAEKNGVPALRTLLSTSEFVGESLRWLRVKLAPRITMHGVLVDVYGEGILLTGESGIGKSETALELIKRGHRFVADDAVEIKKVSNITLIGSSPELIKYFIELRGIGIIDVRQMFGVQSIKVTQSIDLVVNLEYWEKDREYDRFAMQEEYIEILGNNVICHNIPVRPGRNLAIICESTAINHRQKKMGYNAAQLLSERISENINTKR